MALPKTMHFSPPAPDPRTQEAVRDLRTVRDFIRYAVSHFTDAGLAFGHGTSNAYDEAVFLVLETLHLPIDDLKPHLNARLVETERRILAERIHARVSTRKPAPYLVNRAYIQGIPFFVDERVIVPRSFIGEILCAEDGFSKLDDIPHISRIADICTGSGCLAILAAHLFPDAQIDAVDLSGDALEVAEINRRESGFADRISLQQGNLFEPLKGKTYDLIITNPPYVDQGTMENLPQEYCHEPVMALEGGADGLEIVREILKEAANYLTPQGGILCEIGQGREILESEFDLPFLWLDTENSEGEVFWLTRKQLEQI